MKKTYALLITVLMIAGVMAAAFAYLRFQPQPLPECGEDLPPTAPKVSQAYFTRVNGEVFTAVNTTFSTAAQQVGIGNVTFRSQSFFDPSKPHLVGDECVTDPSSPISLALLVTFRTDNSTELLSITYGGDPPMDQQEKFAIHTSPKAGVRWYPRDAYVVLLVRF